MTDLPLIEVIGVSKRFVSTLESTFSLKKYLIKLTSFKREKTKSWSYTVLDNVSFEINKGEFVGIMGRNGAGKSTILKMISGIYTPNHGRIKTRGKIAPLLELGAGFVEELSGLENIYLNAAILGFSRFETQAKLKQIIEFSELGEKIEMPVRTYSSGMLVRLGFSIASHLDAEILLFDEILAVGDAGFQEKCLTKVNDLYHKGKSIILVTHTPELVSAFCSRCIVLDNAKVIYDGPPAAGSKIYKDLFLVNQ